MFFTPVCYSQISTPFANQLPETVQMPYSSPDFGQAQQITDIANQRFQDKLDDIRNPQYLYQIPKVLSSNSHYTAVWDDNINNWSISPSEHTLVTFHLSDLGIEYENSNGLRDYFKIINISKNIENKNGTEIRWHCYSTHLSTYCSLSITNLYESKSTLVAIHIYRNDGNEDRRFVYMIQ
jgi:hypothetical protein